MTIYQFLISIPSYFVFGKFGTSEKKEKKWVHTGKAKCVKPECKAKGFKNLHSFTSESRGNLKKHYEKVS